MLNSMCFFYGLVVWERVQVAQACQGRLTCFAVEPSGLIAFGAGQRAQGSQIEQVNFTLGNFQQAFTRKA